MATQADTVRAFLEALNTEDEKLAKALGRLGDDCEVVLADVVCRFDRNRAGELDADDRKLAARALGLLHRPSKNGLELLTSILTYLDVDKNRVLDHREATLATEVLELFCKADSENETLSNKELQVLEAVLMHLDSNGNGVLEASERTALRDELWEPKDFIAKQKADNPLVREVLGLK